MTVNFGEQVNYLHEMVFAKGFRCQVFSTNAREKLEKRDFRFLSGPVPLFLLPSRHGLHHLAGKAETLAIPPCTTSGAVLTIAFEASRTASKPGRESPT